MGKSRTKISGTRLATLTRRSDGNTYLLPSSILILLQLIPTITVWIINHRLRRTEDIPNRYTVLPDELTNIAEYSREADTDQSSSLKEENAITLAQTMHLSQLPDVINCDVIILLIDAASRHYDFITHN